MNHELMIVSGIAVGAQIALRSCSKETRKVGIESAPDEREEMVQGGFLANKVAEGSEPYRWNWEGWHHSWDETIKAAGDSKKPIFLLFTAMTSCSPCVSLHENIFMSQEFKDWASGVELCVYDFPRGHFDDDAYDDVRDLQAEMIGDHGVPNYAFCRPDGTVIRLGTGFAEETPSEWVKEARDVIKEAETEKGRPEHE